MENLKTMLHCLYSWAVYLNDQQDKTKQICLKPYFLDKQPTVLCVIAIAYIIA